MDAAATVGLRLGSAAVAPLVKRLFRAEPPGAALVGEPVRIGTLLAFRGERRTLTPADLAKLADELVERALRAAGPHDAPVTDERPAVARALADTLAALGELDMDDVQAVRLGPEGLADALRGRRADAAARERGLSRDAELFLDRLTRLACLHIIDFFTRRSTFVARTLVEQVRQHQRLVAAVDQLVERLPTRPAEDAAFEERYRRHLVQRHGRLTIFGLDVDDEWPLDDAYLSLETTETAEAAAHGPATGEDLRHTAPPRRAERALAGLERVLLRGVAGAGKTTLVQWLAVTTAEHRVSGGLAHLYGRVPFVLPLRTLTRADGELPTPAAFLSAVGCPHTPPAGWAERVLAERRGLLLVDGIDEVPEPRREPTRRWLRELLWEFPGNVCLVTARPSAVRDGWLDAESFRELSLAPMSRADVAAFVARWHRAAGAGQDRAEELLTAVRSRPDLARLATNPLMCGLLCALHRSSHGYLPRGREEVYEAGLRMLLERRDRQRRVDHGPALDARTQTVLLQGLAYWLIRNGHSQLERADAVELIGQLLPALHRQAASASAEEIYRHLLDRSGLLREPAAGVVDFVHRTFQDYLAARAAVEARDFPLLVRNAHLDQWEDVVRMAVAHGRPDERARLLRQLIKRGDTVRRHRVRLHLLATACLEHAPQLDPEVRRAVEERAAALLPPRSLHESVALAGVGQVVLELLPGPEGLTDGEALAVVDVARHVGTDAALPTLAAFRDHPSARVRERLLLGWGALDHRRFGREVLAGLALDGAPHLQVKTHAELAALRELPPHPCLALFGEFTAAEILNATRPELVRELSVASDRLTDLGFLEHFRHLTRLSVIGGPEITDLAPLAGLPELGSLLLRKLPGLRDLRPLDALPRLEVLSLGDGLPPLTLTALPAEAPLTWLALPPSVTDLTGIGGWPGLRTLALGHEAGALGPDSLAAVAELPALTELRVDPPFLAACQAHRISLPRVTDLALFGIDDDADLRHLPAVLPGLRELRLLAQAARLRPEPLRELPALRRVEAPNDVTVLDPELIPGVTVEQPPEPRY
ncbi:NACHT domain-containing protein [Streptomyces sp. DSM 44915]|uniref:NACHT domain-containing protein n=1 Tax=Streptomyces chisholmiae TaxID=3075540 RepID=A0ABU2JPX5_9ACTN|nr:NACHT domain-containing protein [Streptomyces sp. DSM 44915]MDT0266569.1 NACHT domain-containing protein [Streptomyces sp. DSM 44915]